jgi:hypothetical protein
MNDTPEPTPPDQDDSITAVIRHSLATTEQPRAQMVVSAQGNAAETLACIASTSATAMADELKSAIATVNGGALGDVEGRLYAQAVTLDSLFHNLTRFAFMEPRSADEFARCMKLALRAQAQSAGALSSLAEIKAGPRVLVTRQLNAAHQQIVNNAPGGKPAARIRPSKSRSSQPASLPEPSPLNNYAPLDARIPREAAPAHQPVEPVDEIHRSAD